MEQPLSIPRKHNAGGMVWEAGDNRDLMPDLDEIRGQFQQHMTCRYVFWWKPLGDYKNPHNQIETRCRSAKSTRENVTYAFAKVNEEIFHSIPDKSL